MALAPDLGERYLDTVYQDNWVQDLYGEDALRSEFPSATDIDAIGLMPPLRSSEPQSQPRERRRRHDA